MALPPPCLPSTAPPAPCLLSCLLFLLTLLTLTNYRHVWSQALCNSFQQGATLLQQDEQAWIWNDKHFCATAPVPPLSCYFNITNHCPTGGKQQPLAEWDNSYSRCPDWITDDTSRQAFRAAAMEVLFSRLSHALINDTETIARELFGDVIPEDMLAVHIRWGDKNSEMRLVDAATYVNAASELIGNSSTVFVVSESTDARQQFDAEVAKRKLPWRLFHYNPAQTSLPAHERLPVRAAHVSEGATGKASMMSLLIALEAKAFVLTTGSNWSRLINELRTAVVDARCGGCTKMKDLQQAHRFHNWRSRP